MLISCRWLNELLTGAPIRLGPPATPAVAMAMAMGGHGAAASEALTPARVAELLTSLGLEVEGSTSFALPGVIVGELRAVERHPNADKLSLVQLFDGREIIQVVCGADNLPPPGGKVAFAPVGSVLPGDFAISAREVRGIESRGMICSETELEIGAEGDGIMVLPSTWEAGAELQDCAPAILDTIIEIAVTPNRPDALGHIGVAIDLAVALGTSTRSPKVWVPPADLPVDESLVQLRAKERCGRYFGYALTGAEVGPSPLDLQVRLHRVGLRAINNVVDITNYVLMETGQPLHAFDRDKLEGGGVIVRRAAAGEPMTTLDGTQIELETDDLVIADAVRPQAVAGIMGGAESTVEADTGALLLEIAWFEPRGVRRSAKRHGFHTDSSHRFERGVDDGGKLELAAKRALFMLRELTGASCVAVREAEGERPAVVCIDLRPARISGLLGLHIPTDEARRILIGLGIRVDRASAELWRCTPPSFRPDLRREVDLIEEVMRHFGLDRIPAEHSRGGEVPRPIPEDPQRRRAELLADALGGTGLHEHLSLAFTSETALEPFTEISAERRVRVSNPLRAQLGVMRTHMLPGLLDAAVVNSGRHDRELGLFEVGRIYCWPTSKDTLELAGEGPEGPTAAVDRRLPREPGRAAILRAGRAQPGAQPEGGQVRRVVSDLLEALEAVGHWAEPRPGPAVGWLHPGVQVGLWCGDLQVGVAGELHPDLARARDLGELEIGFGELWLDCLDEEQAPQFAACPRFPSSARDLSLDLADRVSAADAVAAIGSAMSAMSAMPGHDPLTLGSASNAAGVRGAIEVREAYRGQGVEPGRQALLLRLHYRAAERSVTDAEVQALHDLLVSGACERLRALDPDLRVR